MTIQGTPPTLEWIDVARLSIDPAYQRSVEGPQSRRIISGMKNVWDWSLCQPLVVSRRADNNMFVLDGQHRLTGARERGDVPHLPCVILSDRNEQVEAATFVALNTKRQKLSQADIFMGLLASGDPEAQATSDILEQTGWRMRQSNNTARWHTGDLACAPMLTKAVKAKGERPVRGALSALREAYEEPVTSTATILTALITIYANNLIAGRDPDDFIASIASVEPGDWKGLQADQMGRDPKISRNEAFVRAVLTNFDALYPVAAPLQEAS
ncbi:MAG: DUF6551 family protein [Pontixanthobacter sp.]